MWVSSPAAALAPVKTVPTRVRIDGAMPIGEVAVTPRPSDYVPVHMLHRHAQQTLLRASRHVTGRATADVSLWKGIEPGLAVAC